MDGQSDKHGSESTDSPAPSREIGSLTQPSPLESHFIGSSSGIYFIHTVKKAFADVAFHQYGEAGSEPLAEQTVGGEEDHDSTTRAHAQRFQLTVGHRHDIETATPAHLGPFPTYEKAQAHAIEYFAQWHPLFPFLSGPNFLHELQSTYQNINVLSATEPILVGRKQLCNLIIIRCVLTIGAQELGNRDSTSHGSLSRTQLLSTVSMLASRHDLLTLQTILAAQLYCLSTLALRTASTLSGMLGRLLVHAGLHRCPYRYNMSEDERIMRKRIFWSAYTMDRYLCMSLGIPVNLPDSEIDVCVSGRKEIHSPGATSPAPTSATLASEKPDDSHDVDLDQGPRRSQPIPDPATAVNSSSVYARPDEDVTGNREETLACLVEFDVLIGRVLDIFHKSIHIRQTDPKEVLYLRSEVEKWFNKLPDVDSLHPDTSHLDAQRAKFAPFFRVMYEQIVISINRPALSLPRSLPEFHHSLQITIKAAKNTISGLEKQSSLFWPGYLASVWMSGLILSFASQVGLYSVTQASSEVQRCIALLNRMGQRWSSARRCHTALSALHEKLRQPRWSSSDEQDNQNPNVKRPRPDGPSMSSTADDSMISTDTTLSYALAPTVSADLETMITGQNLVTAQNFDLDMNDIFQNLSWDNLFGNGVYGSQDGFTFEH